MIAGAMWSRLRRWSLKQETCGSESDAGKVVDDRIAEPYVSDAPLVDPKADRFGRLLFASRVANTIAERRDPSSIVIAISGAYGEGKSTVLSFIQQDLAKYAHVVVVPFNPWRFTSEEALLVGFFRTLSQAIDRRFTTVKESLGKLMSDYGEIATELVKVKYQGMELSPGKGVGTLGKLLETATIEDLKMRVDHFLSEEKKRVVVVMDDIDRLDRSEVQAVFRLIKLSADFPYTAYVLAFDHELVAGAIGERFAAGDIASGRSFLEKIIQVPLQLPKATHQDLVDYCLQQVQSAMNVTLQHLSGIQLQDFHLNFLLYVAPMLQTPRGAKRYANALSFGIPLLQGELNIVDVMLLEAVKVFYPATFEHLRDFPHTYTGYRPALELAGPEGWQTQARTQIEERSTLSGRELENLQGLLGRLFPQLQNLWSRNEYGPTDRESWTIEQRVASHTYLLRYLSWSVPGDDYSDREVDELLSVLPNLDEQRASEVVRRSFRPTRIGALFDKIFPRLPILGEAVGQRLATAIAANGDLIPYDPNDPIAALRRRAAALIREIVKRQNTLESRFALAQRIIEVGRPLPFAWWCWSYLKPLQHEQQLILDQEQFSRLASMIADRIANERETLIETYPDEFQDLFVMWAIHGNAGDCRRYLESRITSEPSLGGRILRQHFLKRYGVERDFGERHYDDLSQIIEPTLLYDTLIRIHPALATGTHEVQSLEFDEKILLRQFAAIHRRRVDADTEGK
jgi:hypothetical protein